MVLVLPLISVSKVLKKSWRNPEDLNVLMFRVVPVPKALMLLLLPCPGGEG